LQSAYHRSSRGAQNGEVAVPQVLQGPKAFDAFAPRLSRRAFRDFFFNADAPRV